MNFSFPNKDDSFQLTEEWEAPIMWKDENLGFLGVLGLTTTEQKSSGRAKLDDNGMISRDDSGKAIFSKKVVNGFNPLYRTNDGYMDASHCFNAGSIFRVTKFNTKHSRIMSIDLKVIETNVKKLKNKRLRVTLEHFAQVEGVLL